MKIKALKTITQALLQFFPKKYAIWKKEQLEKDMDRKYGNLTKYRLQDERIEVGEFTYGIPKISEFSNDWNLKIGKFCSISNNVEIIFGGQHHYEYISQYAFNPLIQRYFCNFKYSDKPTKPVIIGNDVWIGKNVTIMGG